MAPSPSKKPRPQLRRRARDDVLLHRLVNEVRSHEKKVRDELRHADETLADVRTELDQERCYTSRVKKQRNQARGKLEDALADLDSTRRDLAGMKATAQGNATAYKRKIEDLQANLAEAARKKNRTRSSSRLNLICNATLREP